MDSRQAGTMTIGGFVTGLAIAWLSLTGNMPECPPCECAAKTAPASVAPAVEDPAHDAPEPAPAVQTERIAE